MKRFICSILAVIMCLSLFACGGEKQKETVDGETEKEQNDTSGQNTEESNSEADNKADDMSIWSGELKHSGIEGFYDPDYDYSADERYKVCAFSEYDTEDEMNDIIAHWCSLMNLEYDGIKISETAEPVEELRAIAEEYDGVILLYVHGFAEEIAAALNETDCQWMSAYEILEYSEEKSELLRPYCEFNTDKYVEIAEYMKEYSDTNWDDAKPEEIGVVYVTDSYFEEFKTIEQMFLKAIADKLPQISDNCVCIDRNSGLYDLESADGFYDSVLSENTNYKYLLCVPLVTNYIEETHNALVRNGLDNNSAIFGIADPYDVWVKDDIYTCKGLFDNLGVMQLEPVVGALQAFLSGKSEPETIWAEQGEKSGEYTRLTVDKLCWVTCDNYRDFLNKVNEYAGGTVYNTNEF